MNSRVLKWICEVKLDNMGPLRGDLHMKWAHSLKISNSKEIALGGPLFGGNA